MKSISGNWGKVLYVGLVVSASVLLYACSFASKTEKNRKAPVAQTVDYNYFSTFQVAKGDVNKTVVEYLNYVLSGGSSLKFSKDNAIISNAYVKVGDYVKKGDLLLECYTGELNIEKLEADVDKYNAEISYYTSMCDIEEKRKAINQRYGRAYDSSDYDEYTRLLEISRQQLNVSTAKLEEAKEQLEGCRIYADIDGTVTYIATTSERKKLNRNETAITLSDEMGYFACSTKNVRLFKLDEVYDLVYFYAPKIRRGQQEVEIDRKTIKVRCFSIEPVADNSNTYEIRFHLETDNDTDFTGDLSASITIVTESAENVLYIPKTSVIQSEDEAVVYVQDDNGERKLKKVEVGVANTDIIEIKEGLELGETVLTNRDSSDNDK
ncbi:MAG: hypothetical protein J6M24_00765 [Lachnospiraceae bacterium]|nr:hypothetical protein [Lachnospiraceae bacterium]